MDLIIPESYDLSQPIPDFSQTQQTQTQPQTQPASQPSPVFPSNLWGVLVSCSPSPTEAELRGVPGAGEAYVERPARVELERGTNEYFVGRHPHCAVRLSSIKVSSWHARIFVDEDGDGSVKLQDTSTNGTFVRGKKVGKNKVTLLESGDEIIFGPATSSFANDFRFVFQGPSSNSAAANQPWGINESSGGGIHAKYDVREQIGKGSFATVRKGIQRDTGKMMAIKIIQKARFAANPKTMEMIQREVEIMKKLDHKFCVQYIDYFEDEQRMWLVMEYVDGGDLLDYVMSRQGLKESETREIALMVCEAVSYLHSQGVAHRDLKPENLLLSKGLRPLCKVTDFGLAKMVDNNTMLRTMCGTPTYLAPEVILADNRQSGYGNAVDAWSIGVVLYSCLTNATPFDESESTPLPERMAARRVDFDQVRENGVSETAINFLEQLLIVDPAKRMSVHDALKHPWLATTSTDGTSVPALPLLVSSLPFNSGAAPPPHIPAVDSPAVTSPTFSGSFGDSMLYSQQLDNLRLGGTPARSMTGFSQTTPDRNGDDGVTTELGDQSADVATVGPTTPPQEQDASMAELSPSSGMKRKEPPSAFSSSSSLDLKKNNSAMSIDPPSSLPFDIPTAVIEVEEQASSVATSPSENEGKPTRSRGRRGAGVAAGSTPRRSGRTSAPVEEALPGPTTRRRAKAARLS